jgi:hypothetical protein
MATRTREQRAASALKLVAKESGRKAAVDLALDTLEQAGVDKESLVVAAVNRAGGIMGSKDVADYVSGEGKTSETTNIKRLIHNEQPFAKASQSPLWLRYKITPHRDRLLEKRRRRQERDSGMVAVTQELPEPVPFNGNGATA